MLSRLITLVVLSALALCALSSSVEDVTNGMEAYSRYLSTLKSDLNKYANKQNDANYKRITKTCGFFTRALKYGLKDIENCPRPLAESDVAPVCKGINTVMSQYSDDFVLYNGTVFGYGHDGNSCTVIKALNAQFFSVAEQTVELFPENDCKKASIDFESLKATISAGLTVHKCEDDEERADGASLVIQF